MRCEVCRKEYFTTHECPGELHLGTPTRPAETFPVAYYLGEMGRILWLDKLAIRRIEHDHKSLVFSVSLWYLCATVGYLAGLAATFPLAHVNPLFKVASLGDFLAAPIAPILYGFLVLLRLAVCHGLARLAFDGTGTFLRLLRPMALGDAPLLLLIGLPLLNWVSGIWELLVFAWVFEEVEGVNRIQAIGISLLGGFLARPLLAVAGGLLV